MNVICLKGSDYHGMQKGRVYPVVEQKEGEKRMVFLTIQFIDRQKTFQVRHVNRLAQETGFLAHRGDPTRSVRLKVYKGE